MEESLKRHVEHEFLKQDTEEEQRNFLENFRFLMMADETEFYAYHTKQMLSIREFYVVVDKLYELNNLWLLSKFIQQNRGLLFREMNEMKKQDGYPDFSLPCRYGKNTMLARMFQVMNINDTVPAEEAVRVKNIHKLTVHGATSYNQKSVPQLVLQGKWLAQYGFTVGTIAQIECDKNKLTIYKQEMSE